MICPVLLIDRRRACGNCAKRNSVLQEGVEKLFFVFPHLRQFPSGCPLLSFLVLFSFFSEPV
jgi:hypothetical protein